MTNEQINACNTQNQLSIIVESYLKSIGEYENSRSESYQETADRLGDSLMASAEAKWFELENANWGGSRPGSGRPKLPEGEKRTMRSMKATDAEWEKIKAYAKELKEASKMFINYKNGELKKSKSRLPEAAVTTQDEVIKAYKAESDECLTAVIDNEEEIVKCINNL